MFCVFRLQYKNNSSLSFSGESKFFCVSESLILYNDNVLICPFREIQCVYIPANFCRSSLYSINFAGDGVLRRIGESAFEGCNNLQEIEIPETVEEIESDCFHNCSALCSVTFAPGCVLKRIGFYAFSNCESLREIEIPAMDASAGPVIASAMICSSGHGVHCLLCPALHLRMGVF